MGKEALFLSPLLGLKPNLRGSAELRELGSIYEGGRVREEGESVVVRPKRATFGERVKGKGVAGVARHTTLSRYRIICSLHLFCTSALVT